MGSNWWDVRIKEQLILFGRYLIISTMRYLHDIPLAEAKARWQKALSAESLYQTLATEEIPLDENAIGRTLAQAVWARHSSPHYHACAMDGYAVRAEATAHAAPTRPIFLHEGENTLYVNTGAALPHWADAVIPIEEVEQSADAHTLIIRAPLPPWRNVRPLGEDIVATELILPSGHTLRPFDLGGIAASGHSTVTVARRPKVAILPTGNELRPIGQAVQAGEIIEYNSIVLAAQIKQWGGNPTRWPIVADSAPLIREQLCLAAQTDDLLLLNAGSSAGSEDFSADVIASLGEVLVHGLAVRPGHPVILGLLRPPHVPRVVPIIGVPGYPVSAALTADLLVQPLLTQWLGRTDAPKPPHITAALTRTISSPAGDEDHVRVVVGKVGEKWRAAPLSRGAGVISSLVRADGVVIVPSGVQGVSADSPVEVQLWRDPQQLAHTIMALGSHDVALDVMAGMLAQHGCRLVSGNVGSLGGLLALKRGLAHLAGAHLLDPTSGTYNERDIRRYVPQMTVWRVAFVSRQQGLIVAKHNPRHIKELGDLRREDVRFINRQRGAGTRVLLDYQLQQAGISAETIVGYDDEEATHLSVAAAIASGRADCGLGIAAAAVALELEFIPLFEEQYELIIPAEYAESALLQPLWAVLHSSELRQEIGRLAGYDTQEIGRVRAIVQGQPN